MKIFERDGIRFEYPADWQFDFEDVGSGWTATMQSAQTAFAMVSLRPDADTAAQLADEALAALRAEYPSLDADNALDSLAGQPAIGHDIDFITIDTSITCWTRCVETSSGPLLLLCQISEFDHESNEPLLRGIAHSLRLDD